LIANLGIDINVDNIDACLSSGVKTAAMPLAVAQFDVLHIGQYETAPFTARRKAGRTLASELIDQCLLYFVAMAKDMRADFAMEASVGAGDLLPVKYGLMKEPERFTVTSCYHFECLIAHAP
jgi:hypothetical protein